MVTASFMVDMDFQPLYECFNRENLNMVRHSVTILLYMFVLLITSVMSRFRGENHSCAPLVTTSSIVLTSSIIVSSAIAEIKVLNEITNFVKKQTGGTLGCKGEYFYGRFPHRKMFIARP